MGQSCTLTGRCVVRHTGKKVNEVLTGNYEFGETIAYGDTDSCDKNTTVITNYGKITIEHLFYLCSEKFKKGDKEFSRDENILALGYDVKHNEAKMFKIKQVYRHKVSKPRWKIVCEDGKEVIITNDHSVMVERFGKIIAVKPADILGTDILITIK